MEPITSLPIIELTGTPKERGRIHGETLRDQVYEAVESWKYYLHQTMPISVEKTIEGLVEQAGFLKAVRKWSPGLVDEVEGIAEASNLPFNDIFALQLMDEGGWFAKSLKHPDDGHCTSLGCNRLDGQPAILAQNLDWINIFKDLDVIFRIKSKDSEVEALVPSVPGVIGTCGMNNQGIGVCTNSLWNFLRSSSDGLPVNFFIRAILELSSLEDAVKFLKGIPHASGENFLVSDKKYVLDFECSPSQVVQFIPFEGSQIVYHTNHPLVNNDLIFPAPAAGKSSHERLNYLEFRLKGPDKRFTLETAKAILRSHNGPICAHQSYTGISGETDISVIYVLKDSPELLITQGPPCLSEYRCYSFQ
jgi:isopenicillin-N N-acyltransferase like protein